MISDYEKIWNHVEKNLNTWMKLNTIKVDSILNDRISISYEATNMATRKRDKIYTTIHFSSLNEIPKEKNVLKQKTNNNKIKVELNNGNFICFELLEDDVDGVNSVSFETPDGDEYLQWNSTEWRDEPELVMCEVMSALAVNMQKE